MLILDLGLLCLELNHSSSTEALDKITSYLDLTVSDILLNFLMYVCVYASLVIHWP